MKKIAFIAALCLCMTAFVGCGEMDKMMDAAKEAAESVLEEQNGKSTTQEETIEEESSEEETTEEATEESQEETTEEAAEELTEAETEEESEEESEKETEPAQVSEGVLYESENVRITFTGEEESYGDYDLKLKIENLTDKKITVSAENISIGKAMVEGYLYAEISAGKTANEEMSFYEEDLKINNIDKLGTVECSFIIRDSDTYETIEESGYVSLKLRDVSDYKRNEGKVVCDADGIKVTYVGIIEDEFFGNYIMFEVENTTGKDVTVSAEDVSVDDVMTDGFLYVDVRDGMYANTDMSFFDDVDVNAVSSMEFIIEAYDSDTYDTIVETDPITVELK